MTRVAQPQALGRFAGIAGAIAAAVSVAGCVSLLPKTPPVQLYQIGRLPPPATAAAPTSPVVSVALASVDLPRAAIGDQPLTLTGQEAAYLAGARWVAPATVMVQEDVERAFEVQGGSVRLVGRGDLSTASALLGLDFGDFEARYENGAAAPPVVVVSVRATLSSPDGRTLATQGFTVRQPAADNRVAPIIAAFDTATTQALTQVVGWTNTTAGAQPR